MWHLGLIYNINNDWEVKTMKRIFLGLLILCIIFTLGGCDNAVKKNEIKSEALEEEWSAEKDLNGYWAVRPPSGERTENEFHYDLEVMTDKKMKVIFGNNEAVECDYTYDGMNFTINGEGPIINEDEEKFTVSVEVKGVFTDQERTQWNCTGLISYVGVEDENYTSSYATNYSYKKFEN